MSMDKDLLVDAVLAGRPDTPRRALEAAREWVTNPGVGPSGLTVAQEHRARAEALENVSRPARMLAQAGVAGQLSTRGDAQSFKGGFKDIVVGVNNTLDAFPDDKNESVDTDGDGEPDQGTEFQLPNFCSWAPAVCDFFKVQKADNKDIKKNQREQIEQDKTFFQKVSDWFDWSQADDELPDNESPEIVEHVTPDLKEDAISWELEDSENRIVYPVELE